MVKKTAVVLFNLGGPDVPKAVRPFLFNLFNDPAIISLPQPLRALVALIISLRRAPIARDIYARLGGGSPILKNTEMQAEALEKELNVTKQNNYKTFIAMRYWKPFANQTARDVAAFNPDEIILLPLYPQFSTTTTASSIKDFRRAMRKAAIAVPEKTICCYPREAGFIKPLAASLLKSYEEAKKYGSPRVLLSAHGLPEKIIEAGDPYQAQCVMTANALKEETGLNPADVILCFQSRVGPLQWIGPSTDDEVRRAGRDRVPTLIVPIAFVSDHSETLVEIDIKYRAMARESGAPFFAFVPPVGTAPDFIRGLAQQVRAAQAHEKGCVSPSTARICSSQFTGCPCAEEEPE